MDALAVGREFGILEGRSFALIHPIVTSGLFLYTVYVGYLGWEWRRARTVLDEINELKKQMKPVAVTPDGTPPAEPPKPSPVEAKIQQLTETDPLAPQLLESIIKFDNNTWKERNWSKGHIRDKHLNAGTMLLGFGVFKSMFEGINTWFRIGKLFPGAGAAITVLWEAAATLVPPTQKGNERARNFHIALNASNVILFIWQIPTGIDTVFKVFEFTNWP
ncbi:uncharacterized protein LOC111409939 [Olea europaea subsp. europaea]|uniref:Uncharacterized protein LOC111409939 n=1 Tax=Olea europaea subsp. europaea TaxID=158383 RepID=A0A8S0UVP6_OLEEU|nr:uncharacterized protein LOC111409939 [Olea europaea subsp. europaea]